VIDLHCHALPGIDDGAPDLPGTIAMARAAEEAGTTMLVATPHIDPWWAVDPVTLPWRAQECRAVLAEAGSPSSCARAGRSPRRACPSWTSASSTS
jgi:protein-tyrosine phosphatase